jgi:DNA-binding response OmpR family regulator
VVIVEDEFLLALQLEDIILDCGHHVIACVPDMEAASKISSPVDVALVDINLRDGPTGPDIARMLSTRFNARIIYVTASSCQIGLDAADALGVVHKPFTSETIRAAVAYALDETLVVPRPMGLQLLEGQHLQVSA